MHPTTISYIRMYTNRVCCFFERTQSCAEVFNGLIAIDFLNLPHCTLGLYTIVQLKWFVIWLQGCFQVAHDVLLGCPPTLAM